MALPKALAVADAYRDPILNHDVVRGFYSELFIRRPSQMSRPQIHSEDAPATQVDNNNDSNINNDNNNSNDAAIAENRDDFGTD